MAHGAELDVLTNGIHTEPSFDNVMRGYHKRQVDRYVARVEAEILALATERDEAIAHIHLLTDQVHQLQADLAEARRVGASTAISFRHLGPRVEQILALAEEQADAIRNEAEQTVVDRQGEADRVVAKAIEERASAMRDFET